MNKNEEIARKNVVGAFNWIVGGYYNNIQDDCLVFLPDSEGKLKDEIYLSALNNGYLNEGAELFDQAPREMRFCGRDFIKSIIDELCKSDSDYKEVVNEINRR